MVFIKELLPNPAGKDTIGEWIALLNDGQESVNLRGWSVGDMSGKKFIFGSQTISPNQELKLPYSLTKVNLNNDGDTIALWNARGEKIDELIYGQASEEEIIISPKITPAAEADQLIGTPPLTAQAFTGNIINPKEVSPLLVGLGLALAFGIAATILTKKLLEA